MTIMAIMRILAPWALAGAGGAALAWFAPIVGAQARLSAAQERVWRAEAERDVHYVALAACEARRTQDGATAGQDASEAARRCDARVESARRAGQAICAIINQEPAYDPSGCPIRELVPAGELRGVFSAD